MEKDEKIGYHKGALETLIKERAELARLLTIVESLIKLHLKALKEEGVDIKKEIEQAKKKPEELEQEELKEHFTDIKKLLKDKK